jgi:hypothetical protein
LSPKILLTFTLLSAIIYYLFSQRGKSLVFNLNYRQYYFTKKCDSCVSGAKATPFSEVKAIYLVWLTKSGSMGLLLNSTKGNIIIGSKNFQQLMRDAVQIADLIGPQLPVYDLIHREFDKRQLQGYFNM